MTEPEKRAAEILDAFEDLRKRLDTRVPIEPWIPRIYSEIEHVVARVIALDPKHDVAAASMVVSGLKMLQHRTAAVAPNTPVQRAVIASGSRGSIVLACRGDILIEDLDHPTLPVNSGIEKPPASGLWVWTGTYVVGGSGRKVPGKAWDGHYVGEYRRPTAAELHVIQNGGDPL